MFGLLSLVGAGGTGSKLGVAITTGAAIGIVEYVWRKRHVTR